MKKIILSLFSITLITAAANAQAITINVDGTPTDISGMEHVEIVTSAVTDEHLVDFIVTNNTGSTQTLSVARRHMSMAPGWSDYFCWGINGQIGTCYLSYPDEVWTGGAELIDDGGEGLISSYINAPSSGTSTIRYYISDGTNYLDSVDLVITSTASIQENVSLSLNVSPNPADNFVNINMAGVSKANVKIVDVLGNVVFKEMVAETTKKVDVSKFRNGIYFITIEAEGVKPTTRKLIIRH